MIRPGYNWITKSAIIVALIAVGYCSTARSLAFTWSNVDPTSALNIWGGDARILAASAQQKAEKAAPDTDQRQITDLARRALARDGMAVPAVNAMAFSASFAGNDLAASNWFAYSEQLSRRDLRAQLYYIEKYVSEGNIKQALYHYDVALRTSEVGAPTILFPILRNAIGDEAVRAELLNTLSAKPIWMDNFLTDVANNGPDFVSAAKLFYGMRRANISFSSEIERALLSNLIYHQKVGTAWRLYVALHPKEVSRPIRNGDFLPANTNENSPFDWQFSSDNGVSAELGMNGNRGVLDYRLPSTIAATVAQQMIFLPPGKYRLAAVLLESSQKLGDGPSWQVLCTNGTQLGKLEMGGPLSGPKSFSMDMIVPPNCETQYLSLIVRASDDADGASGQVGSVKILKAQ